MKSSTVSSKYQVVIPKALRKDLDIKPGQKVYLSIKNGKLEMDTTSALDEVFGCMKGAWGKDSDAYLRELRNEWDR